MAADVDGGWLLLQRLGNMAPGTVIPAGAWESFRYGDRLPAISARYFASYSTARDAARRMQSKALRPGPIPSTHAGPGPR